MSWNAFIRFARVYNDDLLDGPPRYSGTLCHRNSLSFLPAEMDVPLLVDHDPSQEIGRVRRIDEIRMDGLWYVAHATVTEPPPWLKRDTGASFGYKVLGEWTYNGWNLIRRALVREVTVTSPGCEPLDPDAKVLNFDRSSPEPEDEVILGGGIIRRPVGKILGVR